MSNIETIYTKNMVTDTLIQSVKEKVEELGECKVSFDVTGRTKHVMLSQQLEQKLPEYDFDIDYDRYLCLIQRKPLQ